jgi:CRP-like cAMP-binding protein
MTVSRQILGQFRLLQSLPEAVLDGLSTRMTLKEYARRAVVAPKDTLAAELGFLVNGRLQGVDFTVDGRSVGLYFVEPGDYYSELSVVDAQPAPEFVVAAAPSTVAVLDAQGARELIFQHPNLARAVMMRLAKRIRDVTAQRTLLALPNPFQRLCALLIRLAADARLANDDSAAWAVPRVPTHQELAIMINASRETVTRAFQLMFAQDLLLREGDELKLLQPQRLQDIADGRADPPKA